MRIDPIVQNFFSVVFKSNGWTESLSVKPTKSAIFSNLLLISFFDTPCCFGPNSNSFFTLSKNN